MIDNSWDSMLVLTLVIKESNGFDAFGILAGELANYSKSCLVITPYWNIQIAGISPDFLKNLKMKELDPLTNHNHDNCDDFYFINN